MRRAAKVDANQPEIVEALRKAGAFVVPLHAVGKGCPDLAVIARGKTHWFEIKNLGGRGSKKTPEQTEWHTQAELRGVPVHIVLSAETALAIIGATND